MFTKWPCTILPPQALFHENSWTFAWARIASWHWQHGNRRWPFSRDAPESVESQSSRLSGLSLWKSVLNLLWVKNFIKRQKRMSFYVRFLARMLPWNPCVMLEIRSIHYLLWPGRIIQSSLAYMVQLDSHSFSCIESSTLCWTEVYQLKMFVKKHTCSLFR